MKVLRYEAHNVMKVSDIQFDLEGRHLFLVGGMNEQGKTSALTALLMALCGRSGCDYPEIALKEGENKGWVKVDLSGDDSLHEPNGFHLELLLKRKRNGTVVEEFKLLDSSGDPAAEPRQTLKRLYDLRAFDPLAFERLKPQEQREKLMQLVGLDFTEARKQYKELYDERTAANREAAKKKAYRDSLKRHDGVPAKEVSVAELAQEQDRRRAANKCIRDWRKGAKEAEDNRAAAVKRVEEIDAEIARLQAERAEQESARMVAEAHAKELAASLAGKEELDEAEISEKIRESESINEKVRHNQKIDAVDEELTELLHESERLTEQMTAITETQQQMLRDAKWPLPGMGVDEKGVTMNGLPFEQASKRQRVMASVNVAMALNPTLRLLVCQDGGDLDTESLAALEEALKEKDFQMIVELVTRSESDEDMCAVIIQDGRAVERVPAAV